MSLKRELIRERVLGGSGLSLRSWPEQRVQTEGGPAKSCSRKWQ
jgi:hypothetical protein